jgi:integrase/5-methylcytosine-specific restriction endonuclease McrA
MEAYENFSYRAGSPEEIKYELEPIKSLRVAYNQRWRSLKIRSEKIGIQVPDKEELWKKLLDCWNSGFMCQYCGDRMKIRDSLPSPKTFTIEHSLAFHNGGDNNLENIFIICKDCNSQKSTIINSTFQDVLSGKKAKIPGLSIRLSDFFKVNSDGWSSEYLCINILLKHLGRWSRSVSSRRNYLQQIRSFCLWSGMQPDELVQLPKERAELLVQQFADTYNNIDYSRRTANGTITVLRTFFEVNGYRGHNKIEVENYYTPRRYRKIDEHVPRRHEIHQMADVATSLRNRGIILTLYSSGIRNSTLCALRYKDIKDELLSGITNIRIPVYPEMKEINPDACKNSLPYYSFICEEANDAIRLYLKERAYKYGRIGDENPLFSSEYNQLNKSDRSSKFLTSRQIQKIIKSTAKLSGMDDWYLIKPHSFKKSFESVLRSETHDGGRLDEKVQSFLMGHVLPGSEDYYFDRTMIEEIRLEYSKLRFGRVVVENKFKKLRRAIAEAFDGSGMDIDRIVEEYVAQKIKLKNEFTD